jgi:hypothetical protein
MAAKSKSDEPSVKPRRASGKSVLYTLIEDEQQQALRVLAFMRQSAIADIVREALDDYLAAKGPTQDEIDNVVKLVRKSVRSKSP